MMNKILNIVGVMLAGFAVCYTVAAVFDRLGLPPDTVLNSIIILLITVFIVIGLSVIINIVFASRQKADNK